MGQLAALGRILRAKYSEPRQKLDLARFTMQGVPAMHIPSSFSRKQSLPRGTCLSAIGVSANEVADFLYA